MGRFVYAVGMKISIALHDVRSAHNVGSVFRTADAAGVGKGGGTVFLCGYTPAPLDRFGRARPDVAKVALGAEQQIRWESHEHCVDVIRAAQKSGAFVIAIEQDARAINIRDVSAKIAAQKPAPAEILFIFGNETKGLPTDILKLCDEIAFIPMSGTKESLNVSVSVGIALYLALA